MLLQSCCSNMETPTPPQPSPCSCPLCGGVLMPLPGAWRCGRCGYALCLGCEASYSSSATADE